MVRMGRDGEGCHVTLRARDFPFREGFSFLKCAAAHVWTIKDDLFAVTRVTMMFVTSKQSTIDGYLVNVTPFFPWKPPAKLGLLAATLLSPCCKMSRPPAYQRAGGHRQIWLSALCSCFLYSVRTGRYLRRNGRPAGPLNIFEREFLNPEY